MEPNFYQRKNGNALGRCLMVFFFCTILSFQGLAQYPAGSPVAINGKLKVLGNQMVNECNNPVQLRGMSSHGPQWFGNCYSEASLDAMVNDWGIDIFRIAMYVEEGGYVNNPGYWKSWIDNIVAECAERGIYCMIDWHVLNPGDPWANIDASRDFWTYMSQTHSGKKHVLYEIANEPNGVDWPRVKSYAQDIIPRIRANDPSSIIIVGTPTWSQDVDIAANDPLNYSNIMYALHFYSGTHTGWLRNKANIALSKGLALYVTEFGTSQASGDGGPYLQETQEWMDWMAANKISWINWSFADKAEVSAALSPGACGGSNWNNTSASGAFIKDRILNPGDNFVCNGGGGGTVQSPYNGVINLPGTIEAENFDNGGQGVAYNDTEATNHGGEYRTSEAVDIQSSSEGGFNVGWTNAGEWLEYTINVPTAGSYKIDTRVASPTGGSFHINFGATNVTGATAVPNTGGWQNWQTVSKTVNLSAGEQVVRFVIDQGGFNFNKITVSPAGGNGGIVSGQVYRLVARNSGKVLDVAGCSTADGANVQQWPWLGGNCQRWKVEATDNGFYRLISQQSGQALDVNECSTADGANVQQWPWNGAGCQQWKIEPTDNGYYRLVSRQSGKVLDVSGCSTSDGASVHQWTWYGGDCQQWKLEAVAATQSMALSSNEIERKFEIVSAKVVASQVVLYPNPANEEVTLTLPEIDGEDVQILVVDPAGRKVRQEQVKATHDLKINTASLKAGVYTIVIKTQNNTINKKLIINH